MLPRTARKLARFLVATLAVALAADRASAELLAFEGRLLAVLPGLGEAEVASGTGVAQIDGIQLGRVEILGADIAGSAGLPVTDPTAAPVTSIRVAASLRGGAFDIDPFAPPFGEPAITDGSLVFPGAVRICMLVPPLAPCVAGFSIDLTKGSGSIGIGIGGLLTAGGSGTLRVSLYGAPLTVNTAYATAETENGAVATAFSAGSMGGPARFTSTAGQTGGFLSLVTPVHAVGGGSFDTLFPGFVRLEITFLPEPGVFVLLGAGALGLAGLSWKRSRIASGPGREGVRRPPGGR